MPKPLTQETNRTKTLATNIKKAKTNIDNSLINLGTTKTDNLAQIPSRLNIVKDMKKIATVTHSNLMTNNVGRNWQSIYIPLNLAFNPSLVIVNLRQYDGGDNYMGFAISKYHNSSYSYSFLEGLLIYVDQITKDGFYLNYKDNGRYGYRHEVIRTIAFS